MTKRILIDAVYPDETRVVIHENNIIQEFDYETAAKKQIKGNIYLAKITRIEPSLQAAFIEYGADKHGFLPFAEIHPDYYQVPVEDRSSASQPTEHVEPALSDNIEFEPYEEPLPSTSLIDTLEEDETDVERRRPHNSRRYKIQEVLKRNQVILVQAIKEERGNKGASFTSYISLAGRYCVLMPNSERQSGISKRIGDGDDRKRLRDIIESLELPDSISIIIRTAGSSKNKIEIKRDYDYLIKLWNSIREHTLNSKGPTFIHAEGDLIKRTIRDLYDESVSEISIQGEDAFNKAKNFMKVIIPTHVNRIKLYKNKTPIFCFYQVEEQIASLYSPNVQLGSGGYLVINPTEALISIDVNSGRSTSERNVEETATKTNLEAAVEIARQLRMRDLSGLVVIDFIDMSEMRNRIAVEKTLKDALKSDRAKIQLGTISSFGLFEMSRQRIRSSFIEANTVTCSSCNGKGITRAPESNAVMILRTVESEIYKGDYEVVNIYTSITASIYILNHKRDDIVEIEKRYNTKLMFHHDTLLSADGFAIEKNKRSNQSARNDLVSLTIGDQVLAEAEAYIDDQPTSITEEEAAPVSRNKKRSWKKTKLKPASPLISNEQVEVMAEQASHAEHAHDVIPSENTVEKRKPRKRFPKKRAPKQLEEVGISAPEAIMRPGVVEEKAGAAPHAGERRKNYRHKTTPAATGSDDSKKTGESLLRGLWKRITE